MRVLAGVLALLISFPPHVYSYAVLAHEAIIDSVWLDSLVPLIRQRFPHVTRDELTDAHAYAYGGAIIQDAGYYPFGSKLFSDLTHYVRTGDFIEALLRDAHDPAQYAFALGALTHYVADTVGHPEATNPAVADLYPKLKREFGPSVTYEQDRAAHLQTEFGFDVLQVAKGRYAPEAYHNFIGFKVSKEVLDRAFEETYCLKLSEVFASVDLALGTYRHTVGSIIPEMTKIAWKERSKDIERSWPGVTRDRFLYNLERASYEKEWGKQYEKPGVGARLLAFFFRVVPKIGPFKALNYRMPDAEAEKMFMKSFNDILAASRKDAEIIGRRRQLTLANLNLDTGRASPPSKYHMADAAWQSLLEKLADKGREVSPPLRKAILSRYSEVQPESEKARSALAAVAARP